MVRALRADICTFVASIINIPAQLIRAGRRNIYRLLGWNSRQHILFRFLDAM